MPFPFPRLLSNGMLCLARAPLSPAKGFISPGSSGYSALHVQIPSVLLGTTCLQPEPPTKPTLNSSQWRSPWWEWVAPQASQCPESRKGLPYSHGLHHD